MEYQIEPQEHNIVVRHGETYHLLVERKYWQPCADCSLQRECKECCLSLCRLGQKVGITEPFKSRFEEIVGPRPLSEEWRPITYKDLE